MKKFTISISLCLLLIFIFSSEIKSANEPTRGLIRYIAKQISGLESNTSYFPQAFWDSVTFQAVDLTAELCSCLTDTMSVITVAGTIEYALDSNFSNPVYVYSIKRKAALKRIPTEELGLHKSSDTLDAVYYYTRGRSSTSARPSLGLLFANRVDTVKVAFFRQPKRLTTDTSVTDIPREFAPAISHFMASWAFERNKMGDWALYHEQKAKNIIAEVRNNKRVQPDESFAPKVK